METIGKDLISYIALKLDLDSIEKLCQASNKFRQICESKSFWRQKLEMEFPMIDISRVIDLKGLYKYLSIKPKVGEIDYINTVRGFNELAIDLIFDKQLKKGDVIKGIDMNKIVGTNYILRPEDIFIDINFSFPEFPPHYYKGVLENGEVHVPHQEVEDFDRPYIEGKFGEKYNKKNVLTNDDEDLFGVFENYELVVYI